MSDSSLPRCRDASGVRFTSAEAVLTPFNPSMSLFGGEFGMALCVDSLQIARMVDLGGCPAPAARLGLADDVMHLVSRCEP